MNSLIVFNPICPHKYRNICAGYCVMRLKVLIDLLLLSPASLDQLYAHSLAHYLHTASFGVSVPVRFKELLPCFPERRTMITGAVKV